MSPADKQKRMDHFFATPRAIGLPVITQGCTRCRQAPRARQRRPNAQGVSVATDESLR
jgi:hypothetical protein